MDPDALEAPAHAHTAVVSVITVDKGHAWEVCVRDPDGYERGVGILIPPATGPTPASA
jgi:hypothetical protein